MDHTQPNNIRYIMYYLADPFNASQQAISRHKVCIDNPSHPYNMLVNTNTVNEWETYYNSDRNRLYSKGTLRLDNLCVIYEHPLCRQLSISETWFVIAGSIVLLQVYGDGNHRTAHFLYKHFTGNIFNFEQVRYLECILPDMYTLMSPQDCSKLILKLLDIYRNVNS